ncbi:MAG: calcium/sodium antiporter [Pseudomonadota bacterium]|nr:calcium/sodium antiporter [Pseudomonadota bacterium]
MFLDILLTLSGFGILVWGADRFIIGASALARNLGVSPFLIGLTIVGFATSTPEIMVSASAALKGLTGIAIGNAIGSNIANIALVMGVTAIFKPIISSKSDMLRLQIYLLIFLTICAIFLLIDFKLDRLDGLILIFTMCLFLYWLAKRARHSSYAKTLIKEVEISKEISQKNSLIFIIFGFVLLLFGSNLLVNGAENLARAFGVSELIIGLTIVAIGTSLPELAISIISIIKKQEGIAVGNIIGSNVFNLLAVIGVAGIIHPAELDRSVLYLHYPIMILLTLSLLRIIGNTSQKGGFGRLTGIMMLGVFLIYQVIILSLNI